MHAVFNFATEVFSVEWTFRRVSNFVSTDTNWYIHEPHDK